MEQQPKYDEISLRELIEMILRQKKLIIGVTMICLIASFVVSFFVLDPVYQSKAILMTSNINDKLGQQERGIEGLVDTMFEYPQMSIETYKEQINNPHVLQKVIDGLKLGELKITRRSLRDMIELNTIKDTNLITISVQYGDEKVATDIVNTVAKQFTVFVSKNAKTKASKSSDNIKIQMEEQKNTLDTVLGEYKKYLAKPRGAKELAAEVNSKIQLVTKYKTDMMDAQIEEKKLQNALSIAEGILQNTPQKITLDKSLSDDAYLSQIIKDETGKTSKELYRVKTSSEEINDAYIELKKQSNLLKIQLAKTVVQKNNLKRIISSTQKELEGLQEELAEKQLEERIISQQVEVAQKTYDTFLSKYEEIKVAQSVAVGDSTISIVSPAVVPIEPIGPKKMLNMAIAGVLGTMIGVLLAFFREYWKSTEGTSNNGMKAVN